MSIDLPRYASDKVKRALDDLLQLTDDPPEMLRIALPASGVCIGQAAEFRHVILHRDGGPAPKGGRF